MTLRGKDGLDVDVTYHGATHRIRLGFLGMHNALNATGAFALGLALGYSPSECVTELESARPYARRLNVLDAPGGVTVVDDCYNANAASMQAALETLTGLATGGRRVAVLGDMLELGAGELQDHAELGKLAGGQTDVLAFFGPRSEKSFLAAQALELKNPVLAHFHDVDTLIDWLRPRLVSKDVVLVKCSRGMRLERVVEALTGQGGFKGPVFPPSKGRGRRKSGATAGAPEHKLHPESQGARASGHLGASHAPTARPRRFI